jgi:hypothetical protein
MESDWSAVGLRFRVDEAGRQWVSGCRLRSAPVRVVPTEVQGKQNMHLSVSRRSSGGPVLACLILAACAIASSPLSALEGDQKPAPKSNPVKPRAAAPGSGTTPAGAGNADLLQRPQRGIAENIEAHYYLRGLISGGAAKIVDAKLAGPFEATVTDRHLFSPNVTSTATWHCVTAKLMVPIPSYPRA